MSIHNDDHIDECLQLSAKVQSSIEANPSNKNLYTAVNTYGQVFEILAKKLVQRNQSIEENTNEIKELKDRVLSLEKRVTLLEDQQSILQKMNKHLDAIKSNIPVLQDAKYLIVSPTGTFYVFGTLSKVALYLNTDERLVRQAMAEKTKIKDESDDTDYNIFQVSELLQN
jgi:hypothetical protein